MTLRHYKQKFLETLKAEYPSTEVESFFRLLAEAYLGMSRLDIALHPEQELSEENICQMEQGLMRLTKHEPIQYILGTTQFFGMTFVVDENVLIPRPETEELVEWILADVKQKGELAPKILDIGTGSGCIAISLARHLPAAKVSAWDISSEALKVARQNAHLNDVEITCLQLDILSTNKLLEKYDIIVSNPPYVRELEKKEMQPNVLLNEPAGALFVKDEDPLLFYSKITKLASQGLEDNGSLYFEINEYFGKETEKLVSGEGFETELRKDIFGKYRMLKGRN